MKKIQLKNLISCIKSNLKVLKNQDLQENQLNNKVKVNKQMLRN